jgi:hypothetical protein
MKRNTNGQKVHEKMFNNIHLAIKKIHLIPVRTAIIKKHKTANPGEDWG